jgi:hypothetical protein
MAPSRVQKWNLPSLPHVWVYKSQNISPITFYQSKETQGQYRFKDRLLGSPPDGGEASEMECVVVIFAICHMHLPHPSPSHTHL